MGLMARDHWGWMMGTHVATYAILALLAVLFWATIIGMLSMSPFFYPGAIMIILIIWAAMGLLYWMHKLRGYHHKVFRLEKKEALALVDSILTDLGLIYKREEEKPSFLFFLGISYDFVYHAPSVAIFICFRFISLPSSTEIYIGKVGPWNAGLIENIKMKIEYGVRERIARGM